MTELLSPVGSLETFYSAIKGGANAVYLGLNKFSARAYANNFSLEDLKSIIPYAHLRNVKVFITMNTILYDNELDEAFNFIDELAKLNVDAIIVQDLSLIVYIANKYKSLVAHASTQIGVDDLHSALVIKELGCKRIVLARETSIEIIKEIKEKLNIEVEAFIHGALCLSYSGNCLMSSMIGNRSGNRGRCAGCCRQLYSLIDQNNNKIISRSYLLSMKDLNTSMYLSNLKFIDSLKIEGRMKEKEYVYAVTNIYHKLLNNEKVNINDLDKVFNRTYTKGYINHELPKNIVNNLRPNNFGYLIGEVCKINKNKIWIRLFCEFLSKGDQIRIENNNIEKEISIPITKLFDANFNLVDKVNKIAIIYLDKKVNIKDKVYKTKDIDFYNNVNDKINNTSSENKLNINMRLYALINNNLKLDIEYLNYKISITSNYVIQKAITSTITKENIVNQLKKLGDTPYSLNKLDIVLDDHSFISLKAINELRREAINKLNKIRLKKDLIFNIDEKIFNFHPIKHNLLDKKELTIEVSNLKQYEFVKSLGIKHVYYKNIINRNNAKYLNEIDDFNELLINNLGSISYYKNKNVNLVSDYSFNVTNYLTTAILSTLNVNRITLSHEISLNSINDLVNNYHKNFNTYPNLELIIYGRVKLMHSKYCPLSKLNLCGECKRSNFVLKDRFQSFPIKFNDDCTTFILNSKKLNNIDYIPKLKNVNYFRLVFNDESLEEIKKIIDYTLRKINGENIELTMFNSDSDTHGHFFKNPL